MTSKSGYSLVELMMVIGIIGVAGASAIPSLVKREPQRQIDEATWRVYMDLQQAKAQAVSESRRVKITVNNSLDQYSIWVDSNENGTRETGEVEIKDLSDTPDVDLHSYPTEMAFGPSGTSRSTYYYFYMRVMNSQGNYRYVYVFPNGHIDPMRIQNS